MALDFFCGGDVRGPIETLKCRVINRRPLRVRDSGSNQSIAQVGEEENGCTRCVRFFAFGLDAFQNEKGPPVTQRPKSREETPKEGNIEGKQVLRQIPALLRFLTIKK